MPVWKEGVLDGGVELVGPEPSYSEGAVLPNDSSVLVDEKHAVVEASLRAVGCRVGGYAGAGHESEVADSLSVVGAEDRAGGEVVGAESELPDDVAGGIDLYDSIVELVGDQDIARIVEASLICVGCCYGDCGWEGS